MPQPWGWGRRELGGLPFREVGDDTTFHKPKSPAVTRGPYLFSSPPVQKKKLRFASDTMLSCHSECKMHLDFGRVEVWEKGCLSLDETQQPFITAGMF